MLSRVAESIFWMSRYVERAENIARFIDVNLRLVLDTPMDINLQWEPLVQITADEELFSSQYSSPNQKNVLNFLIFNVKNPNSITSCVSRARDNARTVREVITAEMWLCINEFYLFLLSPRCRTEAFSSPNTFLTKVKNYSQLLIGLAESTMVHNEGWHFIRMGHLLERADKTSRSLDMKYFIVLPEVDYVGTAYDTLQWAALLKSVSALDVYRKQYHRITPSNIVRFLFFQPDFPRSVKYCLRECDASLHEVTMTPPRSYSNPAERQLGILRAEIEYADVNEIVQVGLHEYIDPFHLKLNKVDDTIMSSLSMVRPSESETMGRRTR